MNHAKQYEEEENPIFRVASSGVVYGTQGSIHSQNEGWELLIRNISSNVHHSLGQFSHVCWGLSMLFNPRDISDQRFSIGFKSGYIADQSMCWAFSSPTKSKFTWYWSMFPSSTWNSDFPLLWKASHIVTPPPSACTLGSTHSSSRASWACLRTRTRPSWRSSKNLDISLTWSEDFFNREGTSVV